ncbi:MAG: CDP-alcohol phosphatidyltransferase family protein, partial [Coriobacteriales bacterium]|nr:CDP-alcohol phosphatidyltransferase family protein [Coriobacteriales bacterium]
MSGSTSNKIFTIPNLLTLIRLLCVPVFFVLLVFAHHNLAAFIFFAIAAVTDFFDGALARGLGQVSELGKQFDPLVDRILILAAVLGVLVVGRLPWWLFLILVARDASMLLVTVYMERRLGRHFSVVFIGKLATAVLMFSLCAMILDLMPWGL